MRQETVISEAYETGDLSDFFKSAKFVEGENLVFRDSEIGTLVAIFSNGVIKDWIAYDKAGTEVPTVVIRQPAPRPKTKSKSSKIKYAGVCHRVCACFPEGDRCWWVCWRY